MIAVVIYDSLYGNTAQIAQAIGDGLSSLLGTAGSVEVVKVGDAHPNRLAGFNLLLVGGPTHGSRPSPAMHAFLKRIPKASLVGVRFAAFDTRTDMDKLTGATRVFGKIFDRFGYAAPKIASSLANAGGQMAAPPEGFIVKGTEGPLEDGELERARAWAIRILNQEEHLRNV